jgi:uncharacterized membrane protein
LLPRSGSIAVDDSFAPTEDNGMNKTSKFLFGAMSSVFGICILGLILGMIYSLYESLARHQELWAVLSHSILYYRILGAFGIVGFLLFLVFLLSLISGHRGDHR